MNFENSQKNIVKLKKKLIFDDCVLIELIIEYNDQSSRNRIENIRIPLKETRANDEETKFEGRSIPPLTRRNIFILLERIYGVHEIKKTRPTIRNQSSMPSRDNERFDAWWDDSF